MLTRKARCESNAVLQVSRFKILIRSDFQWNAIVYWVLVVVVRWQLESMRSTGNLDVWKQVSGSAGVSLFQFHTPVLALLVAWKIRNRRARVRPTAYAIQYSRQSGVFIKARGIRIHVYMNCKMYNTNMNVMFRQICHCGFFLVCTEPSVCATGGRTPSPPHMPTFCIRYSYSMEGTCTTWSAYFMWTKTYFVIQCCDRQCIGVTVCANRRNDPPPSLPSALLPARRYFLLR